MKRITIPKGWRRLKAGDIRQRGDKHYMSDRKVKWHPVAVCFGRIERGDIAAYGAYIRRIARKKGGKRK